MKIKVLDIGKVLAAFARQNRGFAQPMIERFAMHGRRPFPILVATLLSLRTKDEVTDPAAGRLFAFADTPEKLLAADLGRIERAIYPVGFWRKKAANLKAVAKRLIDDHGGEVPSDMEGLLALPGVGRKTANLVLSAGFGLPGICVDTHVHRIMNRLGYVRTKSPDETEAALRAKLPARHWMTVNATLVVTGQNVCMPVSPRCSACPVEAVCPKAGVERRR